MTNSSGVNRLKGIDVDVRTGVGNRDGVVLVDGERVVVAPAVGAGVRYDEGR